ncbi:MAG: alpha-amylase family glycosyl hydrolase, partial [Desulfovermiculus sp.]
MTATYRQQFNPDFTFAHSAQLAGYLHNLGVSHLYASPVFQAVPGSTHGYDVVDPARVNEDLGGYQG